MPRKRGYSKSPRFKRKIKKVMEEFENKTLKTNGRRVTKRKQAIAIALSEARRAMKK